MLGVSILTTIILAALTSPPLTSEAKVEDEEKLHFAGIVLAVDSNRGLVTVEEASAEGPQMKFHVMEASELTRDGKTITLKDIEVGDPVSIEFENTTEGNQAHSVDIITSPTL